MVKKKAKRSQVTKDGDVDLSQPGPGEKCSKCGNEDFAISKDVYHKRYCTKCNFVWLPKDEKDIIIDNLKADIGKHKDIINSLNVKMTRIEKENKKLKQALGLDPTISMVELDDEDLSKTKKKMTTEDLFS